MIFDDLIFKFTFFKKMSIEKQGKTERAKFIKSNFNLRQNMRQ